MKNINSNEFWFVYILKCGDGSLYTGLTNDLEERVKKHCSGKGAKYTRSHLPVTLVYHEKFPDRSLATKRESEIKKLSRKEKLLLIEKKLVRHQNIIGLYVIL
ncbi:GIY-YIG nuclease family protein [Patescibacteria group bacterium]|nr:GIY-YIG nuclease family protein [Patescibacteria group bacterium]